jgi:hypothetical protein
MSTNQWRNILNIPQGSRFQRPRICSRPAITILQKKWLTMTTEDEENQIMNLVMNIMNILKSKDLNPDFVNGDGTVRQDTVIYDEDFDHNQTLFGPKLEKIMIERCTKGDIPWANNEKIKNLTLEDLENLEEKRRRSYIISFTAKRITETLKNKEVSESKRNGLGWKHVLAMPLIIVNDLQLCPPYLVPLFMIGQKIEGSAKQAYSAFVQQLARDYGITDNIRFEYIAQIFNNAQPVIAIDAVQKSDISFTGEILEFWDHTFFGWSAAVICTKNETIKNETNDLIQFLRRGQSNERSVFDLYMQGNFLIYIPTNGEHGGAQLQAKVNYQGYVFETLLQREDLVDTADYPHKYLIFFYGPYMISKLRKMRFSATTDQNKCINWYTNTGNIIPKAQREQTHDTRKAFVMRRNGDYTPSIKTILFNPDANLNGNLNPDANPNPDPGNMVVE